MLNISDIKMSWIDIEDSAKKILEIKRGKDAGSLSDSSRMNEQELYTAMTHSFIKQREPGLLNAFETGVVNVLNKIKERGGEAHLSKAADRVMRSFVRTNDLSKELYKDLRMYVFGKSQLDSNRIRLSAERAPDQKASDTPLRSISTIKQKLEGNLGLSEIEFKEHKRQVAIQSRRKLRERRAAGVDPLRGNVEAFASKDIPLQLQGGFTWKPISESDGKLVILFPPRLNGKIKSVAVVDEKSGATEFGRFTAIANGNRSHFRFAKEGGAYKDRVLVVKLESGDEIKFKPSHAESSIEA